MVDVAGVEVLVVEADGAVSVVEDQVEMVIRSSHHGAGLAVEYGGLGTSGGELVVGVAPQHGPRSPAMNSRPPKQASTSPVGRDLVRRVRGARSG